MKLYYAPGTSALRCRWLLEELGVDYELCAVDLAKREHKDPDYLKLHPLGSVPALVDGERVYIESAAIVLYLCDRYADRGLAPELGDPNRGYYYQWSLFAMTNLDGVIHRPYVRHVFGGGAPGDGEERAAFVRQVAITDELLRRQPFLLGDRFSAADLLVGSLLDWADACGLLGGRDPQAGYLERLRQRPAYQRAIA